MSLSKLFNQPVYNLGINVKHQTISIEHHNRILTIDIDPDDQIQKIPVISARSIFIPPYSMRSIQVTISISSISSCLLPKPSLCRNKSLTIKRTFLNFRNYRSLLSFSNTSSISQLIRKAWCVGFLFCRSLSYLTPPISTTLHKSLAVTRLTGESTASTYSHANSPTDTLQSRSLLFSKLRQNNHSHFKHTSYCNTISSPRLSVNNYIDELVQLIQSNKHREDLRSLLAHFSHTFDTSKHNIANTLIHHVINTVPHSSPACKPYPQPDKEQAMYKLIQEFLRAGLISESHSPYAAPAILVKKKDGSCRFVVDYKKLNLINIKDSSPLPNMEDTLRKLGQG